LTPGHAEDYANFFDTTPHDVNIDENKCYCVTWRSDDSYDDENAHWYPTREERRANAVRFVKDGCLQGYLAYSGGKIVGWCNATANCKGGVDYLRAFWPIEDYRPDILVKSIFCFVIAPEAQRMGVATRILERVCLDAAEEGFDYAEAYVNKEFTDTIHEFRGPLALYEKCGFDICAVRDGKAVVRKALK
jgi:GNAT superfamily N-acetyltransferase